MGVLDGVLGGLLSGVGQAASSWMNWQSQKDTNALNESLTREQWSRDDNAVQRRSADMAAAGINPLMAAGSPAASSAPARMEAPQVQGNVALSAIQGAAASQGIAQSQAQTALTQAQADKTKTEADILAHTAEYSVDSSRLQNQYLADSLNARLASVRAEAGKDRWDEMLAQANAKVTGFLSGFTNPDGSQLLSDGGQGSLVVQMERAKLAATNAGYGKLVAETSALSKAVVANNLDAAFLRSLGLPPMLIDIVLSAASTVGKALR
jgi:hypothetical protein